MTVPQDFEPYKNWRIHPLKGKALKGFWSLDVTENWRLLFKFDRTDAYDLDFIDTH